ncbi:conserved exported hypothetical protein [Candidatus Terasakiella magnetica]|uniref:DUF3576 domain-containing protein n=1 Tax=Candidatus Terasakiella magnetica TaxID=1867952 RepID=A0A1C3RGD8_9PROT|nr:DUF3576 domain-containing protein [Candidatus Terasakiella magnetica]SCA56367.1 conserved exported hypothetical protein [Candidatus Terasakiella magnetica]
MCRFNRLLTRFAMIGAVAVSLSACEGMNITGPDTFDRPNDKWQQRDKQASVFGDGGLSFGGKEEKRQGQGGTGIGVNAYLWRATLDTVSFMPLASADPFGGVVLTDWHSASESPNERYKLNVYILGQSLRADGIRVAAFRQVKNATNEWQAVSVDPKAVTDIENAILTRARQLRTESMTQ